MASRELTDAVARIVRQKGLHHLPEPVQLSSGAMSQDFVDAKQAVASGPDLELACRAILETADELAVQFEAAGGMTLGADAFAHGLSVLASKDWFVVRKAVKGRGTNRRIEGAALGQGIPVLLLDDVVTTGGNIREAYDVVRGTGASVVGVVCLVDRSDVAAPLFAARGVPYGPVLTYRDLDIEPVKTLGSP